MDTKRGGGTRWIQTKGRDSALMELCRQSRFLTHPVVKDKLGRALPFATFCPDHGLLRPDIDRPFKYLIFNHLKNRRERFLNVESASQASQKRL